MQTAPLKASAHKNNLTVPANRAAAKPTPLMSRSGLFLMSDLDKAKKALDKESASRAKLWAKVKAAQDYTRHALPA